MQEAKRLCSRQTENTALSFWQRMAWLAFNPNSELRQQIIMWQAHFPWSVCLASSLCNHCRHSSMTGRQIDISEQSLVPAVVGGEGRKKHRASEDKRSIKVLMSMLEARRWFLLMTKLLSPVCSANISRSIARRGGASFDNCTAEDKHKTNEQRKQKRQ